MLRTGCPAAAVLLAAGTGKRPALLNARCLIHQPYAVRLPRRCRIRGRRQRSSAQGSSSRCQPPHRSVGGEISGDYPDRDYVMTAAEAKSTASSTRSSKPVTGSTTAVPSRRSADGSGHNGSLRRPLPVGDYGIRARSAHPPDEPGWPGPVSGGGCPRAIVLRQVKKLWSRSSSGPASYICVTEVHRPVQPRSSGGAHETGDLVLE